VVSVVGFVASHLFAGGREQISIAGANPGSKLVKLHSDDPLQEGDLADVIEMKNGETRRRVSLEERRLVRRKLRCNSIQAVHLCGDASTELKLFV
jgi:hypothetical protein